MVWGNLPLYHLCKYLLTLCHNFFVRKDKTRSGGTGISCVRPWFDPWYCLDWFVLEGTSQVSMRSEVGNTKRRSLNTWLSSGTSKGFFAVSAGPYRNYHAKVDTKNEPWHDFGSISKKGSQNQWSSRFEPNPLHRYEFGPPKFLSKTFAFSMIFYSTWQILGGGQWRKACRSREKESKQSEIT